MRENYMFTGSLVALVSPMQANETIDKISLANLIEWHIGEKTDGFVVSGTTGEGSTLTNEEHADLIKTVVKQVAKRVPVLAGTGSHSTHHTLELSENAKKAGADACLIVTPYYNKPPQNGLFMHYKTIAENTSLPIILYNVPGRTACDLLPETVERLAKLPNIIGIKEATGKPERALEIQERCGKNFAVYSGDDATALTLMLNGAKGVISVTANVAPRQMHELSYAATTGNKELAEKINAKLLPLHQKLFLEANPIPVKWALAKMGKIAPNIRLPLVSLDPKHHAELMKAMEFAQIQL